MDKLQRVLFVDDDPQYVAACKRQARRTKEIAIATTSDEARRLAATTRFDLAIVDYMLGNESCLKLVDELKHRERNLPVVVVSSFMSFEVARLAGQVGVDAVFAKPFLIDGIVSLVERGLSSEPAGDTPPSGTLADVEREHITRVLRGCRGNISEASRLLGIDRTTLQRRLRRESEGD